MVQFAAIQLDRSSSEPLYRQLAGVLAGWIRTGALPPGTKLPAGREFSSKLGLNRATVQNAISSLAEQHLVRSHVGQGTFVCAPVESSAPKKQAGSTATNTEHAVRFRYSRALSTPEHILTRTILPRGTEDPIDFASMMPDENLFPVERFRQGLDQVLRTRGKELLQYGNAAGYPPLRSYIAERLSGSGITVTAENILIVNGTQQGLDLVCRALLDPADAVAVEDPTYTIVPSLLAQYHAEVHGLRMTSRGLDINALESLLTRHRPKFVYTMPTFHNPTGISMDKATRQRLIQLAERYDVPIVEDDFDSELRFHGERLPSLKSLDEHGSVLQIGTFSKGLFPGLRLGWVIGETEVIKAIGRAKVFSDYHTSPLLQAGVLEFCQRGHYDEHLERLIEIYSAKAKCLAESIRRHFPDRVHWSEPDGGFASWVSLPQSLSAESLLEESAEAGVLFTPGPTFFISKGGAHTFRLSISRVPIERIEEGVRLLGGLIEERLSELPDPPQKTPGRYPEPAFHI